MPTRPGWMVLAAAVAALVVGRVFAIVELFVIGIGLGAAVGLGVLAVRLRRPRVSVGRWIHPSVLTVGDTGRVDLAVRNDARSTSPRLELTEPVGPTSTARLAIAPLRAGQQVTAGYRVPAGARGVLVLGPLEVERRDLLGLASSWAIAAGEAEVMVAPRTIELTMPALGHGVLGRHLLAQAQRMGPGEFHSLRDYVTGDEPRSIHWRASARSEGLKVRQHTTEGVRRCIVVLDRDAASYPVDDPDAFERAIVVAASLVQSSDRTGLTTRFVTSGGIDLRGPEVASQTLRVLAPIELGGPLEDVERDPGEGLGLVVVVAADPSSVTWRRAEQLVDPTLSRIGVFTVGAGLAARPGRLVVDASTIDRFRDSWEALTGRGALDPAARPVPVGAARNGTAREVPA